MKKINFLLLAVYCALNLGTSIFAETVQQRSKMGKFRTTAKTVVTPSSQSSPSELSAEDATDTSSTILPDDTSSEVTDTVIPAPAPIDTTPIVIPQKPVIKGNVFIINALPYPLSLSSKISTTAFVSEKSIGPNMIQPGQVVKAMSYKVISDLKPKQWLDFSTVLNGTIAETQQQFSVVFAQRIINDGISTNYEYSMRGTSPIFNNEWAKQSKELSNKITLGQTDLFFAALSHETPAATSDIYYCISPKLISLASATTQAIIGKNFENINQLPTRIWQDISTVSSSALTTLDPWPTPRPELRYDQTAFLGTHLSFVNSAAGFLYTKQLWSIAQQLKNGVRVLELNISPEGKNPDKLCYGDCNTSQYLNKNNTLHNPAIQIFNIIKQFLDSNPKEIVTIILTSKLNADAILNMLNQIKLTPLLLTKATWDPINRGGFWPRVGWMQDYKQRLVIFDQSNLNPDKYGYPAKQYVVQNTPYTLDLTQAAKQLLPAVTPKPRMFQCNYYGILSAPTPAQNSATQLQKLLNGVKTNNYLLPDQTPNFFMLDHVETGNPMSLVNELNKAAKAQ